VPETGEVPAVDREVVDLGGDRVDFSGAPKETIVLGPTILREIVNVHHKRNLAFGEGADQLGKELVLAQGRVMKVPALRFMS